MFLSHSSRYNPFEEFNRAFNSFWDEDFSDYFSTMRTPYNIFDRKVSREEQLRRRLNSLHNQENEINHYIKQYESQIQQLKKNRDQVEKKRNEITDQIAKISEESQKIQENKQNDANQNTEKSDKLKSEGRVFKRVHYISDGMEIEEQYDSTNPKNCYKIIRKQGEIPQVISSESNLQIEQSKSEQKTQPQSTQPQEEIPPEKLGDGLDEKLEQLSKITGKSQKDLRNFLVENKELTLGQLYDKLNEPKQS